jgi:hypothetical protein
VCSSKAESRPAVDHLAADHLAAGRHHRHLMESFSSWAGTSLRSRKPEWLFPSLADACFCVAASIGLTGRRRACLLRT